MLLAACGGSGKKEEPDLSATFVDMATTSPTDGGPVSSTPGPGAALACETSGKNAFLTYGATKLVAINETIFAIRGADFTL